MPSGSVPTQTTSAAEEISSARLVGIKLHREVLTHRFRDGVAVLTSLNALLRDHLDLCSSVIAQVRQFPNNQLSQLTNLFWNQI